MAGLNKLLHGKMTRNALWLIGAKIYQLLVNLAVTVMMARFLGPSNYGLIHYAASLAAMFTSLCTLGINSILVNELLCGKDSQGKTLGSAIGLRLVSSLCSVVTIVALARVLNPGEPTTVRVVAVYSTTLLFQCFDTINYWYQAKLQSRTIAVISAAGYTASSVYQLLLLVTKQNVLWFAASHVVQYALVAVLLVVSYYKNAGMPLEFHGPTARNLLSKSYHFVLSGLMVALYGQMDRVMLKAMLGDAAVGYYSAAAALCGMWPFVLQAVIDSAKPVILEQFSANRERFARYLAWLYGGILWISFGAAVVITLLSQYLILLLYGEAYLPARSTLCILCWNTGFAYLGVARSIWLVPQGKQKYEKVIAASGAACNLALNMLMIPRWGVNGAALATLFTQIFTNFIVGFFFREIRPNNQLILKSLCWWRREHYGQT